MTPRQLKYFVAIARCGSIATAASHLHIAQPSLSQHLAALEEELGVAVFERHARGVTLTVEGQRLLERATSLVRNTLVHLTHQFIDDGTLKARRL
ncbi:MAG: LysR family transcriptional regulator [Pigmentiphaga sp.]